MRRWRERVERDCLAALRSELADLRDTIEQSLTATLHGLHSEIQGQQLMLEALGRAEAEVRGELAEALNRLAGVLGNLLPVLEVDRRERLAQTQTVECLLRELLTSSGNEPAASRLLGGTIDSSPLDDEERTIDLRPRQVDELEEQLREGTVVQVRSHFQDRWSDGFRVSQLVCEGGRRMLRLTRSSDGMVLPVWFDASDVRPLMR